MSAPGTIETAVNAEEEIGGCILRAVADAKETTPMELPVLYDTVDVEAVERLRRSADESLAIGFDYAGYRVRIDGEGSVSVAELDG